MYIMQNNLEVLLEDVSIANVCHNLLDRLDKQPIDTRSNDLRTPINEKQFSQLFHPSSVDEDIRLEEKIHALISIGLFDIKQTNKKAHLPLFERDAKLIFNPKFEDKLRKFYHRDIIQNAWLNALRKEENFDKNLLAFLENNPIKVKNKSDEEIIQQLLKWTQNIKSNSARKESARCFWGLSKVFDKQEAYKIYFGLEDMPISLLLYMQTASVEEVLFIENKDTFYEVCESGNEAFQNSVIIYASGYMASAKRIRQRRGSKIYLESSSHHTKESIEKFTAWLYKESSEAIPVYFWGDLDYEGMNILKALKVNFKNIDAWERGYEEMLEEVKKGFGHTPVMANKEGQVLLNDNILGCSYADQILVPVLDKEALFIDQEIVIIDDFKILTKI